MWEIQKGVADNPLSRELPYCVFPTLKGHVISLQKSYLIKARALACLQPLIMTSPADTKYSISLVQSSHNYIALPALS